MEADARDRQGGSRRATLARAAILAIEPLVELLLEIGTTSPEAESLLRSVFVHKARARLTAQGDGEIPSDARVALVTGVHRNFVRKILSVPPQVAQGRERRGYLSGRVLKAWLTLPPYRNESGKPLDLPEKGPEPSFATLVAWSLPAAAPRVVLEELIRAGVVESLSDHRVRVRARRAGEPGLNLENLAAYSLQGRDMLTTLMRQFQDSSGSPHCDTTSVFSIDARRIALVRDVIARRAASFLLALEQELGGEGRASAGRGPRMNVAVSVVETNPPKAPRRRGASK
jgi:Family of unknown function (DUF6502)